ncbi:hypothetical protein A8A01_01485 [Ewingella americana]|nr:hypothetical protein A8A01_01485 [Ewingella americana]
MSAGKASLEVSSLALMTCCCRGKSGPVDNLAADYQVDDLQKPNQALNYGSHPKSIDLYHLDVLYIQQCAKTVEALSLPAAGTGPIPTLII